MPHTFCARRAPQEYGCSLPLSIKRWKTWILSVFEKRQQAAASESFALQKACVIMRSGSYAASPRFGSELH
jgi:hypothetical protein